MNTPAFHSILVASDLGPGSEPVLRAAAALSRWSGAQLHLLHAAELPVVPSQEGDAGLLGTQQRIRSALDELEEQLQRTLPAGIRPASAEVLFGTPGRTILERAKVVEADLIVLGPHRRRPVGDLFLGSTADRVIRGASAPCLIVRGEFELPLRRLMVPLDLSDPSRGALDLALGWAMQLGEVSESPRVPEVEVQVVHVIPQIFGTESFPFDREVVAPELDREVQGAVVRTGAGAQVEVCEKIVWGDVPAEEIVAVAEEERPDLLVIATHGYGAFLRALIGSVASHVARLAPCSVLLVPPTRWAADEPTVDAWAGITRSFVPPTALL